MSASAATALDLIPEARREVLRLLKRRGPVSVRELADKLGVSPSGVRQHLSALERDGAVTHEKLRDGPGRPRHVYRLSVEGDALFPRRHGELANELLAYVDEAAPDILELAFARRRDRRIRGARSRLEGLSFAEKVHELARILDEDGYEAEATRDDDGVFHIVERNCAVRSVAEKYRQACTSEIDFLRAALPEAHIRRTSHIVSGGPACAYRITKQSETRPGQEDVA